MMSLLRAGAHVITVEMEAGILFTSPVVQTPAYRSRDRALMYLGDFWQLAHGFYWYVTQGANSI